jgi:hypothetical protein
MPWAGFESAIPAGEWLQTDALDRSVTGTGAGKYLPIFNKKVAPPSLVES